MLIHSLPVKSRKGLARDVIYTAVKHAGFVPPQCTAVDAEIKVPSDETTELQCSPFKAWSR